jgi:hypothetical protein
LSLLLFRKIQLGPIALRSARARGIFLRLHSAGLLLSGLWLQIPSPALHSGTLPGTNTRLLRVPGDLWPIGHSTPGAGNRLLRHLACWLRVRNATLKAAGIWPLRAGSPVHLHLRSHVLRWLRPGGGRKNQDTSDQ